MTSFYQQALDPRTNVCWLTGFTDAYTGANSIDTCHIIDRCVLSDGDPRIYDPNNMLKLQCHLHRLFDARRISFSPIDGSLITNLSKQELLMCGVREKNPRLHPSCLTQERLKYLGERLGWDEFCVAKGVSAKEKG